ncbi:uncharacterized protein E0L32_007894 [Thyridium curvatum]|uniref:AB hydrolase-1 domain-containing protein n=1 Tax=Thyridium curvatum TaxID=1093900 RepID=A0A507ALI7_9PEZI|nr:uncharacterized protein E0L32_007894 [Thyridium curvatum]TPX11475.1 hypothetical protein E0L32_007894 [Thyridium curvatum]
MAPTAFILVPGSFSPPLFFHKVSEQLRNKGHQVIETSLPTCVQDRETRPVPTLCDDVAMLGETIKEWADKGYDVVLGMNSYGGFPGSESVKGYSKTERAQNGLKGGVVGLAYLASFLPDIGESVASLLGESMPDQLKNPQSDFMELSKEGGGKWILNCLPEKDADYYMSKIGYHSRQSYLDSVSYSGWHTIPTWCLIPRDDYGVPPAVQKRMYERAAKQNRSLKLVEADGDHVPMLSNPDTVVSILLEAAGKA